MTTVTDMAGLNILVCMKFLPDSNQLQADSSTGRPDLKRAQLRINTFDENAIEAGLQLAAQHGGRVNVAAHAFGDQRLHHGLTLRLHQGHLAAAPGGVRRAGRAVRDRGLNPR